MSDWVVNTTYYTCPISTRTHIINELIGRRNYKTYLEIGVGNGQNIKQIKLPRENIVSVDPAPECDWVTHPITSDAFFAADTRKFDLIFIDGLHLTEQVDKDIANAFDRLNEGGTVVLHDCNPAREEHAGPEWIAPQWNGTVWQSVVKARCTNPNLSIAVVDTDYGCGVFQRGTQTLYTAAPLETCLTWKYFSENRREILNLISPDDFIKTYLQ